ncbi:hypothetical protein [Bacillus alkalisoli]|uniref:hypothetical protein n=1 Tax=Bacillus alkalisoli TaxID=2011008 RepID=UPI0012FF02CD|nr:hypothetical protein [Bacillus alkalisoli]
MYNKEDTVAVLDGREIKVEDILWLYSLEGNAEDKITGYLKQSSYSSSKKYWNHD